MFSKTMRATMDACRSLGRLLRRMSSTPARRAVELDEEDNWCLLSDNESDHGTPNETELANFSPAETLEEDLDPGWVADFTVAPAAEQIPSGQGRVNCSKMVRAELSLRCSGLGT